MKTLQHSLITRTVRIKSPFIGMRCKTENFELNLGLNDQSESNDWSDPIIIKYIPGSAVEVPSAQC